LVEDFAPFRAFVTSLLAGNLNMQVFWASNGLEAVTRAQQLNPDLILMDISLPELDGLEAARRIRELVPSSKIVFLTQESSAEIVQEALSLGAWGYVAKRRSGSDLLAAVTAALQGKQFVSEGLRVGGVSAVFL
jgi:DNA-binding NarL/FixJ family response regulator